MSQAEQSGYVVDPALGLEPLPAGTNLLVSGPALSGTCDVVHRLLNSETDGVLFASTDDSPEDHVAAFEGCGGRFDDQRMALVCCAEALGDCEAPNVRTVSRPGDLTGVGMQWSALYQQLTAAGYTRVRTGFDSLSTILTYVGDLKPVFRFLHTVTSRVNSTDGLGVFSIDPDTQEEGVLPTITQLFDGRIDVRTGEHGTEIRAVGLEGQPEGWHRID